MDSTLFYFSRITGYDDITLAECLGHDATRTDNGILLDSHTFADGYLPANPDMFPDEDILFWIQEIPAIIIYIVPISCRDVNGIGKETTAFYDDGRFVFHKHGSSRSRISIDKDPVFQFDPSTASIKAEIGSMQRTIITNNQEAILLGRNLTMLDMGILPYLALDPMNPTLHPKTADTNPCPGLTEETLGMKE